MKRPAIDWERVFAEYLGGASFAALARQYGISYSALYRKAKSDAWAEARERVRGNVAGAVSDRLSGSAADAAELMREIESRLLDELCAMLSVLEPRWAKTVKPADVMMIERITRAVCVLHDKLMPQEKETVRIEVGEAIRELGR